MSYTATPEVIMNTSLRRPRRPRLDTPGRRLFDRSSGASARRALAPLLLAAIASSGELALAQPLAQSLEQPASVEPTPPRPAEDPAASQAQLSQLSASLDGLYRAQSSQGVMTMTIVTPQYTRALTMEVITRGMTHTLIRIQSPLKERGVSTLKKGDQMWNYLPKVKKELRVPPSMMMGSWMGSDVTNDDLVRGSSWASDYEAALERSTPSERCVRYTPRPKAPVLWTKVIACFQATDSMPTRQDFYDEKGRLARRITYDQVRLLGGRRVPTRVTVSPQLPERRGHQTILQYEQMSFDVPIDDQVFSLSNLRRER